MADSRKPDSSRLNLFYILQILANHSDEDHPMSASEISDKLGYRKAYPGGADRQNLSGRT